MQLEQEIALLSQFEHDNIEHCPLLWHRQGLHPSKSFTPATIMYHTEKGFLEISNLVTDRFQFLPFSG
ncbi:hypothetical protein LINGRAPRIM_LOCUS277 [Linum grandiflorum]